jgi:hypothetical protein
MAQVSLQAQRFLLSAIQSAQCVFQFASGHLGLGCGLQIVQYQTHQSHCVMKGGGRNRPVRPHPQWSAFVSPGVRRRGKTPRHPCLQDQRQKTYLIHLKAGAKIDSAAFSNEPPAAVWRRYAGLPKFPQTGPATVWLPAFRIQSPLCRGAKNGYWTAFAKVQ